MLIHNPRYAKRFAAYGILLPILDSRAARTFDYLANHPTLGPLQDQWLVKDLAPPVDLDDVARVHDAAYVDRLRNDPEGVVLETFELIDANGNYYRYDPSKAELPLPELLDAALLAAGGTVQCCRIALERGFCYYLGGGTHHAMTFGGRGFCPVNDIVIAIRKLQAEGLVRSAWVVDVDAHKGDGTAELTLGDDSILTLSVHMKEGWPLGAPPLDENRCLRAPFLPSDVDIPIPEGGDAYYLDGMRHGLHLLESLAAGRRPDLVVVVGGADPYEGDVLPSSDGLKLTLADCLARDQLIYRFLASRNLPQAWLMSGGYGPETWHVNSQVLEWALLGAK